MTRGDISPSISTRTAYSLDSGPRDTSQTAIFRSAAPPLLFAVLVAGLLIELRMRLAPPPPPLPGVTATVQGTTVAQSALIWAEERWPGMWALPVLCAGVLGVLRAVIWAGAAVVDSLEERGVVPGAAGGVRIGRWEDGGSVSGSELLAGVFT
jgi:hypothetical protein